MVALLELVLFFFMTRQVIGHCLQLGVSENQQVRANDQEQYEGSPILCHTQNWISYMPNSLFVFPMS